MIFTTEAIVLKCIEYSNTSQILHLFTDTQGKVALIAKGTRRKNKTGISNEIQLLNHLSLVYYQRTAEQLGVLQEYELRNSFLAIRTSLAKIFVALHWLELLKECTNDNEPNLMLFHTIRSGLQKLCQVKCCHNLFFYLQAQILNILGLNPHIESCIQCQTPIHAASKHIIFAPQHGGIFCAKCHDRAKGVKFQISGSSIAKMLQIQQQENTWDTMLLSAQEGHELLTIFRYHLGHHLHKDLQLSNYISEYVLNVRK